MPDDIERTMPTAEATLLAECAAAMRDEWERYVPDGNDEVIDQRAFAVGLRVLRDSEPTEAMVEACPATVSSSGCSRAMNFMLGALLAGDEG